MTDSAHNQLYKSIGQVMEIFLCKWRQRGRDYDRIFHRHL